MKVTHFLFFVFAALVVVFMVIYDDQSAYALPEVNDQNCESNDVALAIKDKQTQLAFVVMCLRRAHLEDDQMPIWSAGVRSEPETP